MLGVITQAKIFPHCLFPKKIKFSPVNQWAALCAAATVRNWVPLTEIALTYFTTTPDLATVRPTCRRPAPGAGGFDSGADQRRPTGTRG